MERRGAAHAPSSAAKELIHEILGNATTALLKMALLIADMRGKDEIDNDSITIAMRGPGRLLE